MVGVVVDGDTGLVVLSVLGSLMPLFGCVGDGVGVRDGVVEAPVVGSWVDNVESVAVPAGAVVDDWVGDVVVDCATATPGIASAAAAIRPKVFMLLSCRNQKTDESKMRGKAKGSAGCP